MPTGGWEAAVYSVDTDDFVSMCITSIDKTGGLFVFDLSSADAGNCVHCLGWCSRLSCYGSCNASVKF